MRGGKIALTVAFATAMMLALAGSYAGAQTMGEYGATLNSAGIGAEEQGATNELAGEAPNLPSAIDAPSPLDSGNDPLSEAPSYLEDSGSGSGGLGSDSGSLQDGSSISDAPTVQ
jgi:hypothetical protein